MGRKDEPSDSPLRRARHEKDITLKAMALRTHYSVNYLSAVERGRKPVTDRLREEYGRVLRIDLITGIHADANSVSPMSRLRWVFRWAAPRRRIAILLVSVLVLGMASAGSGERWLAARAASAEQEEIRLIKETITDGTATELAWYKQPTRDLEPDLERYFLPLVRGGDRLPRIEWTIKRLRDQNARFADYASRALIVNDVSLAPDDSTAMVETVETWYQPLVREEDGVRMPAPPGHPEFDDHHVQQYMLRKIDGRWYIQSNPVP